MRVFPGEYLTYIHCAWTDEGGSTSEGSDTELNDSGIANSSKSDLYTTSSSSSTSSRDKGKGKADASYSTAATAPKKRRLTHLNKRRPVITLRKDSGWDFSQDAFVRGCVAPKPSKPADTWHQFPSYTKEQYAVARLPVHEEGNSQSSNNYCTASLADCDCFDHDLRKQPETVEIFLSAEEKKRFVF